MSLSLDPRLPYLPKGQQVTGDYFSKFLERFYDLYRELSLEIDSRSEALENYNKQGPDVNSANNLTVGEWAGSCWRRNANQPACLSG